MNEPKVPEWAGMQIARASYALGSVTANAITAQNLVSESRFLDALTVIENVITSAENAKRQLELIPDK